MRYSLLLALAVLSSSVSGQTADTEPVPGSVRYPRKVSTPAGEFTVHVPQVDAWENFDRITGRAAIEVKLADMDKPVLGSLHFEARSIADLDKRTVTFYDLEIVEVQFPRVADEQSRRLEELARESVTRTQQTVPLDVVLNYLDDDLIPAGTPGLSMAPPKIFYSTTDSRLLILDGEPILVPIDGTDLQFAVNTNWDLFYQVSAETWFVRDQSRWFVMQGESLDGRWATVGHLPADFGKLPDNDNWADVRGAIPAVADNTPVPQIFISRVPAELIFVQGEPVYEDIDDTGISYVANTESDLFRREDKFYYLVSGRWFEAAELGENWSAVENLPPSFADIPPDHPRGDVLVAVPGTIEAKLAILEASIPRKAEIDRGFVPDIEVSYAGDEPQFAPVPGTDVYRAVNSQYDVLETGGRYYLCYNAVWYVSPEPVGPWAVTDNVPEEIYAVPADSPVHHVTHVHVYDSDDDSVTNGYDSGYSNVYWSFSVMYGTGWYYPPYYYYGYYPYYYWYPRSYGSAAWYNPATGNYGRGQTVYGPYGGAGRAAVYNPETGTYARGRAVWDSDEIARQAIAYNPRTGTGVYTNRYANENGAWGESLVKHDDKWLYAQTERRGNTATTDFKTSGGASGTIDREYSDGKLTGSGEINRGDQTIETEMIRTEGGVARKFTGEDGSTAGYVRNDEGDLFAGKDGEVYKREDGDWYKYGGDEWEPVDREAPAPRDSERASGRASNFDLTREDIQASRGQLGEQRDNKGYRDLGATADRQTYRDLSAGTRAFGGSPGAGYTDVRTQQLNRDYRARSHGYDRYNKIGSRRAAGGGFRGRRR